MRKLTRFFVIAAVAIGFAGGFAAPAAAQLQKMCYVDQLSGQVMGICNCEDNPDSDKQSGDCECTSAGPDYSTCGAVFTCECNESEFTQLITGGARITTSFFGTLGCHVGDCPTSVSYHCSCNIGYAVRDQGTAACSCALCNENLYCQPSKWGAAAGTGIQKRTVSTRDCDVCVDSTEYRCAPNYYKSAPYILEYSGCSSCPDGISSLYGGQSAAGADSITGCYQPGGTDFQDDLGIFQYPENCHWKLGAIIAD